MAWVKTGTVAVTNGSTTVTGTGTSWFGALQTGWGFVGPDQGIYEILTVDSATEITLATPYLGANASAQSYAAFPTNSLSADLTATLQALIANYQGVYDTVGQGRFLDGVLAAPGMAFDADRDTGIFRPGANILGLVAGAVEQLRLTDGVASGAAVQSSNSDTDGDGKLVRVEGAKAASLSRFGVYHGPSSGFDLDAAEAGFSGLVHDGNPGAWPVTPYGAFVYVTTEQIYTGDAVIQQAIYGYATTGTPGKVRTFERIRANDGSAWSAWVEIYHQGSILGIVAQSGGVPTGAVIERGSNANGEYVRFADGTQICWCEKTSTDAQNIVSGALYRTAGQSVSFPAAFADASKVQVLPGHSGDTSAWFTADPPTVSAAHVRRLGTLNTGTNVTYRITAIGTWF